MKKVIFYLLFLLFTGFYCQAQNRVEVFLNGELQKISKEAIRVTGSDKVEIKI